MDKLFVVDKEGIIFEQGFVAAMRMAGSKGSNFLLAETMLANVMTMLSRASLAGTVTG